MPAFFGRGLYYDTLVLAVTALSNMERFCALDGGLVCCSSALSMEPSAAHCLMKRPQKTKASRTPGAGGDASPTDRWVTQMRRGLLEFLVLAVLRHQEAYGYAILNELQRHEGPEVTESTLYLLLARLTKESLLTARQAPSPEGPPRRYYSLTAAGRHRLIEMTAYWKTISKSAESVLRTKRGQ